MIPIFMYSMNLGVMAYGALHSDHTFKLGLMAQRFFFWNKVYKTEVLLFNKMNESAKFYCILVKCGWTCVCKPLFKAILKGVGSF